MAWSSMSRDRNNCPSSSFNGKSMVQGVVGNNGSCVVVESMVASSTTHVIANATIHNNNSISRWR